MLSFRNTQKQSLNKGFTLVELLVVIAIIAILTTIGVGNFRTARIKAKDAQRKSDLEQIAKSLEAYANDHRQYPPSDSNNIITCKTSGGTCSWGMEFSDDNGTIYMAKLPSDPSTYQYQYVYDAGNDAFTLYTYLENENDSAIDNSLTVECSSSVNCNYKITSTNKPI